MKRTLLVIALLVPLRATADTKAPPKPKPPAKISHEDMLDLENANLKFSAMDRQIADIQRAAGELRAHRDALLKKYGLTPDELGSGRARIGDDGTIMRTAAPSKK